MKLRKNAICRRILALGLSVGLACSMAACGGSSEGGTAKKEGAWAWVPEFLTIEDENVISYDTQLAGDALCSLSYDYDEATQESSQSICRYSLEDGSVTKTELSYSEEKDWNLNCTAFARDGSMYGVANAYDEEQGTAEIYLCRFDAQGNQVLAQDMTDLVGEGYVSSLALDGEGRIYAAGDANIWLFDQEGRNQGNVSLDFGSGWIRSMGMGKDGKMYVCYSGSSGYKLADIDFEGKKTGNIYENFPGGMGGRLVPGIEKELLVQDGSSVYEYDVKSQSAEELFAWLDSDINGNSVQNFGVLEDGRIFAVTIDWDNNENGVALLTRTASGQMPQKQVIVVGSLYGDVSLEAQAVEFNKASEKYHISIRCYLDFNDWNGNTEESYLAYLADGINRMNSDIISSNCPDILDLTGLNVEQLAAKGVFEDLNGYLEKSEKLSRSDFLENIIDAYTIDGALVSIPYCFQLQTVVGKASEVGSGKGWTIDELVAYADAHPDAELFDTMSREQIMVNLMMYNVDSFLDWSAGECRFDSEEFKNILDFVKRFPDESQWHESDMSTPSKIQQGKVLLYETYMYNFDEIQMCNEIFQGDASYIGYPTTDGSTGCMLTVSQSYAITSKSGQKEGAWEFMEGFLTRETDPERNYFGFPTLKSTLNTMAEAVIKTEEDAGEGGAADGGTPYSIGGGGGIYYNDGWSYEYRKPTREEVDLALSLIETAKPVSYSQGDEVLNIINEEAAAFYKGQKSADEVATVIQSRIKIYIGENR